MLFMICSMERSFPKPLPRTSTRALSEPSMETVREPIFTERAISDDSAFFVFTLPSNLLYFKGHFEGFPVLPGVVQLDWVMVEAGHWLGAVSFEGVQRLKFMRPMLPDMVVRLDLKINRIKQQLIFRYSDEQGAFSSGRINLRFKSSGFKSSGFNNLGFNNV